MIKIPVKKSDDGIEHYSGQVDPAQLSRVTRSVCDGRHWYLYEQGDEVPEQHEHETMTAKGADPVAVQGAQNLPL